jgi:ABC-type uncharacterized transport system permease subunit
MLTLLSIWVVLFVISIILILLRDDRDIIISDLFCKIFITKKITTSILNFIVIFITIPFSIPFTIHHLWNQ